MKKTAVYPGSFDPVTLGHLDIIRRAASMFNCLKVTVMVNTAKTPLFLTEERVKILKDATANIPGVEVDSYHGLLIDYCREKGIEWFASAWDVDSQAFLAGYDLKYNKIASAMLTKTELLEMVAKEGKYVQRYTDTAKAPETAKAKTPAKGKKEGKPETAKA